MFLFKAAGATYRKVVTQAVHAFQYGSADGHVDEAILLSKNREDCHLLEKQVQHIAKLRQIRLATPEELERLFPGVGAAERWNHIVELYWVSALSQPFNLSDVPGFSYRKYNTAQRFKKLDEGDSAALLAHLVETNAEVLLDTVNNAEPSVRVRKLK